MCVQRDIFWDLSDVYDRAFSENNQRLLAVMQKPHQIKFSMRIIRNAFWHRILPMKQKGRSEKKCRA